MAHFHVVLVHLPIGILLLAALFTWLSRWPRWAALASSIPVVMKLGALAAIAACLTGWLLAETGEYAADTLTWHRWLGIGTAVVATAGCFLEKKLLFTSIAAVLLIAAGHFGGTLTHGEGYLAKPFESKKKESAQVSNVQEAHVYADIVAPIFEAKCQSCHGAGKQKGGLRLDSAAAILKGGKNGKAIIPGKAASSELLRRCLLPAADEAHMPPKQKPQLTAAEIEILQWWVAEGADFEKQTKALPQTQKVKTALATLPSFLSAENISAAPLPPVSVAPAQPEMLEKLRRAGVFVSPAAQNSNWLGISFSTCGSPPIQFFYFYKKLHPSDLAQSFRLSNPGKHLAKHWQNEQPDKVGFVQQQRF